MFLASSWNVQKYKVAEVQIGLLADQIERKPRQGCPKPQIPSKTWLESADRMGVPTKESRQDRRKNRQVSGERTMKAVELFTGAGGLALGIVLHRAGWTALWE
jgi:hypothetical protein